VHERDMTEDKNHHKAFYSWNSLQAFQSSR
jgi:hypothetical protein